MKRAITDDEKSKKKIHSKKAGGSPNNFDKLFNKAYKVFKDEKEINKHVAKEENRWDYYSATQFGVASTDYLTDTQKTSFEFYICGWLQYYDEIARNRSIDHTIYFKWKKNGVVVYISPKPGNQKNIITSPPATRTSDPQSPTAPPPPNP